MSEAVDSGLGEGVEHPGIKWGPFTARIPFIHTGVAWPELAQGIFVAGATGLGLGPSAGFSVPGAVDVARRYRGMAYYFPRRVFRAF